MWMLIPFIIGLMSGALIIVIDHSLSKNQKLSFFSQGIFYTVYSLAIFGIGAFISFRISQIFNVLDVFSFLIFLFGFGVASTFTNKIAFFNISRKG